MRTLKLTGLAFLAGAFVAPIGGAVAQEEGAEPVEESVQRLETPRVELDVGVHHGHMLGD